MTRLPPSVRILIDELDKLFPARTAKPSQSERQTMYDAGQRSVVELLLSLQNAEDQK